MTRQETLMLMGTLRVAYPQYYARQSAEEANAAVGLWQMMFAQDDAKIVSAAVKAFIATDTKGFPPVVGQIKEKMDTIMREAYGSGEMTAMEAWALVQKAIRNGYYNAEAEYAKLPDTIRAVLGGPSAIHDYAMMDTETVNSVVASNFRRSYDARKEYVKEMRMLPDDVKAFISEAKAHLTLKSEPETKALPGSKVKMDVLTFEE